jgi:hypothetical protein
VLRSCLSSQSDDTDHARVIHTRASSVPRAEPWACRATRRRARVVAIGRGSSLLRCSRRGRRQRHQCGR